MRINDVAYNEPDTNCLWTWERMLEKTRIIFSEKEKQNGQRIEEDLGRPQSGNRASFSVGSHIFIRVRSWV